MKGFAEIIFWLGVFIFVAWWLLSNLLKDHPPDDDDDDNDRGGDENNQAPRPSAGKQLTALRK